MQLGDLVVDLVLNTTKYNDTLAKEKQNAYKYGREIEKALGFDFKLTPKVDHKELEKLNKHIELKRTHIKEVQRFFNTNPLKVKVDTSELDKLDSKLKKLRDTGLNVKFTSTSKSSLSSSDNKEIEALISKAVENGFKKGFASVQPSSFSKFLSGIESIINGTLGSITRGAFENLGAKLSHSFNKSLVDTLETALSKNIGSFGVLGKNIGELFIEGFTSVIDNGITKNIFDKLNAELKKEFNKGARDILIDVLGREDVVKEGLVLYNKRRKKNRKQTDEAREGAIFKTRDAKRESLDVKTLETRAEVWGAKLESQQKKREELLKLQDKALKQAQTDGDEARVAELLAQIKYNILGFKRTENLLDRLARKYVEEIMPRKAKSSVESRIAKSNLEALREERLPKTIRDVLKEVAGKELSPEQEPRLFVMSPEEMKKIGGSEKIRGGFHPLANALLLRDDVFSEVASGNISEKTYDTLYHELYHALQRDFGSTFRGFEAERAGESLAPSFEATPEEQQRLDKLLPLYSEKDRQIENDAYLFGWRKGREKFITEERKKLRSQLSPFANSGGQIPFSKQQSSISNQIEHLQKFALSKDLPIGEKLGSFIRIFEDFEKDVQKVKDQLSNFDELDNSELKELLKNLISLNSEFKEINDLFINTKADFLKTSKEKLANRKKQAVIDETISKTGDIAAVGLNKAGEIGRSGLNKAGELAAALPLGAIGNTALQVAGTGYRALQGVENFALDMLPAGRTAKGAIQQTLLPAAVFGGATHLLPGGEAVAHGLSSGASHLLQNPVGANVTHVTDLLSQITSHLPNAFGIQDHLLSEITRLNYSLTQLISGGLGEIGTAILGGKAIQTGASRTLEAALPEFKQPFALPPAKEALLVESLTPNTQRVLQASKEEGVPVQETKTVSVKDKLDYIKESIKKGDIDKEAALKESKIIADKFKEAYSKFKKLSKSKNTDDLDEAAYLAAAIYKNADRAIEDINIIVQSLNEIGQETGFTADEIGSRLNNLKSQLSRKRNLTEKYIRKNSEFTDSEIDFQIDPKKLTEDLIVNSAGLAGSLIGGQHGMVAGLGGDLIGALIGRMGVVGSKAAYQSITSLSGNEEFEAKNSVKKLIALIKDITTRLQTDVMQSELGNDLTGDIAGYSIGNLSSQLLNSISGIDQIPLKGAAVASVLTPLLVQLREDINKKLSDRSEIDLQLDPEEIREINDNSDRDAWASEQLEALKKLVEESLARIYEFDAKIKDTVLEQDLQITDINSDLEESLRIFSEFKGISTPFLDLEKKIRKLAESFKSELNPTLARAAALFLGFQVVKSVIPTIVNFATQSLDVATQFEKLEDVISFSSGSPRKGAANIAFLREEVSRLKLDLGAASDGYSQLLGSTIGTDITNDTINNIFSGVSQASSVFGLDPERQSRVFTALSQSLSKATVQSEELRGQLGESLPGSFAIMARALGVTTQELNKMLDRGAVASETAIPKFAQQLAAETSAGLVGALKSSQAQINEFNTALTDLQLKVGNGIVPVRNLGLNVLTKGLETLQGLLPGITKLFISFTTTAVLTNTKAIKSLTIALKDGLVNAFKLTKVSIKTLLVDFTKFAAKALVVATAIEAVLGAFGAQKDTSNGLNDIANQATNELDAFNKATGSVLDDPSLNQKPGFLDGIKKFYRDELNATGKIMESVGLEMPNFIQRILNTNVENQISDIESASDKLAAAAKQSIDSVYDQLDPSEITDLGEIIQIDKQIEDLQSKLRATDIGDEETRRKIQSQIDYLFAIRGDKSQSVGLLQKSLQTQLTGLEQALEEYNNLFATGAIDQQTYNEKTQELRATIDELRKSQKALGDALKGNANVVQYLEQQFKRINFTLQDTITKSEKRFARSNAQLSEQFASGNISSVDKQALSDINNQDLLNEKLQANREAIIQLRQELKNPEILEKIRTFGLRGAGSQEILTKAGSSQLEGSRDQQILEQAGQYRQRLEELQLESLNIRSEIANSQAEAQERLIELDKSISDYFRDISDKAIEMEATLREIDLQTEIQKAKNRLQSSLSGFSNRFFGDLVSQLEGLIEQLYEPLQNSLNIQNQIRGYQQDLRNTLIQGQELSRQFNPINASPSGQVGFSPFNVHTPYFIDNSPAGSYDFTLEQNGSFNTPVPSPVSGVITEVGPRGGYGNTVAIQDASTGMEWFFAHLDSVGVQVGQQVAKGFSLGVQGTTGNSTGEHIHAEIFNKPGGSRITDRGITRPLIENYISELRSGLQVTTPQNQPSVSSGASVGGVDPQKIQRAMNYFLSQGLSTQGSSYLVGNLIQESRLDPNAVGDGGRARGLAQWHPDRRRDMPSTFDGQLAFVIKEMMRDSPNSLETLRNPNANRDQLQSALRNWERYGVEGNRYQYGEQVLKSYGMGVAGNTAAVSPVSNSGNAVINQANSELTNQVNSTIMGLESQLEVLNEASANSLRQRINQFKRSIEDGGRALEEETLRFERQQEDIELDSQIQTPNLEYKRQIIQLNREEQDIFRDLDLSIREAEEGLEILNSAYAEIENLSSLDASVATLLPDLDSQIAGTQDLLSATKELRDVYGESFEKRREYLEQEFNIAEETRRFAAQQQELGLQTSRNEARITQLNREGNPEQGLRLGSQNAIENFRSDIERQNRDLAESLRLGQITNDEFEKMKSLLFELNSIGLDNLTSERNQNLDVLRQNQESALFNSNRSVAEAMLGSYQNRGLDRQARDLEKSISIQAQEFDYNEQIRQIEEMGRTGEYTSETVDRLKKNLELLNEIKLDELNAQYDTGLQVLGSVQGAFQGAFADLISGSKSAGEAFKGFIDSILNSLANMAAQFVANELFGAILGTGSRAQTPDLAPASGGFLGDALGIAGMFLASEGGKVPAINTDSLRNSQSPIGDALRREGPDSVLAALTPGERVLTVNENMIYERLGLDSVLNMKNGGVVGKTPSFKPGNIGSGFNISVPVTVNASNENNIDGRAVQMQLEKTITEKMIEMSRPNGLLYKK